MSDHAPTPEQREAIEARGSVAVRAGAGSGKTTVLAERYVHLLRPGPPGATVPDVRRLLAITFTERAAAEMRGRIRDLVARELARRPAERAHWARVQRDLIGAHISTIHAFCARLVREHPIEAAVDPDARVLDADETRRYLDARIEAHLRDLADARHPGVRSLLRRERGLRGGRGGGAVATVGRVLTALGRLGRDGGWLQDATNRWSRRGGGEQRLAAVVASVGRSIEAAITRGGQSPRVQALAESWPEWRAFLAELARAGPRDVEYVAERLARLADATRRIVPAVRPVLRVDDGRPRGRLVEALASSVAREECESMAAAVAEIQRRLVADKRRDTVLTFDDLIAFARDLVLRHPAVRRRVAGRFDAVLLDECQDTDPVQAELLRALTADGGVELFVVGDEKQAIYGFRGADVAVFDRLLRELPARFTLGLNFRSVPSILGFVNAIGARVFERPHAAAVPDVWTTFGPEHHLRPHRTEEAGTTAVRLVTGAGRYGEVTAAGRRELEARVLAEVITDLTRAGAVRYADVTVLFRSLTAVKTYELALARRGIPYHVVKGRGFFQRPEVRDVVNLLAAVMDPRDGLALAAVLRSPWVGLGDDELWELVRGGRSLAQALARPPVDVASPAFDRFRAVLADLRARRSRGTIAELLVHAIEELDLDAVSIGHPQGDQQAANIRKVLDLARSFERAGGGGLAEFVGWMRRRDAGDEDEAEAHLAGEGADAVRLMTIHQAKGLEFPVVIVVDLGRAPRSDTHTLVIDEDAGLVAAPLLGAGGHALASTELAAHRSRSLERAQAEHARLFYVACTRARHRLVLIDVASPPAVAAPDGGVRSVWGHAIWDLLGSDRVAEIAAGTEPSTAQTPGGARVVIEPASRWLGDVPHTALDPRPPDDETPTAADLALVDAVGTAPPWPPQTIECAPTDLAEFQACPRRYWYRTVVGVREPGDGGRRARLVGSLVHAALERWASGVATDAVAALGPSLAFRLPDPAVRAGVVAEVERAIGWLEAERARGVQMVARELPFVLAVADDVVVRGRIDVLLERDGELVVRDYKYATGSEHVGPVYREQLGLYAAAIARAGGRPPAAELLFLRPEPRAVPVGMVDPSDAVAAAATTARALHAARAERTMRAFARGPTDPSGCRRLGCGYVRRCWVSDTARDALPRPAEA